MISESAKNAKTVPAMLEAVNQLRESDTVQAIPYLARIDRRATGWLYTLFRGSFQLMLGLAWFYINVRILAWVWQFLSRVVVGFLESTFPDRGGVGFVAILLAGAAVLFRSSGLRDVLLGHERWPDRDDPIWPIRFVLQAMEWGVQATMVAIAGIFLVFSLLPIVFLALDASLQLAIWWQQRFAFSELLQSFWLPLLSTALFISGVVYMLSRRSREKLIRLNLIIWGGLGLADITWAIYNAGSRWLLSATQEMSNFGIVFLQLFIIRLQEASWWTLPAILAGLAIIYPVGWAITVTRFVYPPFPIFRNGLYWLQQRILLRWHVARTLSWHRHRNRQQIDNDFWAAVCQEHLLRFTSSRVRRSYLRKITYFHCPKCNQDNSVYTNVECIGLQFDDGLKTNAYQAGQTLFLNGKNWLDNNSLASVPIFDAVIIGNLNDEFVVERFITAYTNLNERQTSHAAHKPLKGMTVRLQKDCSLPPHHQNLLHGQKVNLIPNFDPKIEPNACMKNIRRRESWQKRNRRVYRIISRVIKLILLIFLLAALYLLLIRIQMIPL